MSIENYKKAVAFGRHLHSFCLGAGFQSGDFLDGDYIDEPPDDDEIRRNRESNRKRQEDEFEELN